MAKFGFDTMTLNDADPDEKKFELAVYEPSRIRETKEAEVSAPAEQVLTS